MTGVSLQALVVYTGVYFDQAIREDANTLYRLPDSSLENAPLAQMAYMDQSSSIRL